MKNIASPSEWTSPGGTSKFNILMAIQGTHATKDPIKTTNKDTAHMDESKDIVKVSQPVALLGFRINRASLQPFC